MTTTPGLLLAQWLPPLIPAVGNVVRVTKAAPYVRTKFDTASAQGTDYLSLDGGTLSGSLAIDTNTEGTDALLALAAPAGQQAALWLFGNGAVDGQQDALTSNAAGLQLLSAAGRSLDLGANGLRKWTIDTAGNLLPANNGAQALGSVAAQLGNIYLAGGLRLRDSASFIVFGSTSYLIGEASNVLALRNGGQPQVFRIYDTYTDTSNWDRLKVGINGNYAEIVPEAAGTGIARHLALRTPSSTSIYIGAGGSDKWVFNGSTGAFTAVTDNAVDIGTNVNGRPRNVFVAGYLSSPVVKIGAYSGSTYGLGIQGGGARIYYIGPTTAPTVAPQGTPGTTSYSYFVVAKDSFGNKTLASAAGTTSTGAAALDATNFNRLTWPAVPGAASYDVLKGDTATSVALSVVGTTYDDKGTATAAYTAPARNNTGDLTVDGQSTAARVAFSGGAGFIAHYGGAVLENGLTATNLMVANTYANASNFEVAGVRWSSNVAIFGTTAGGPGSMRNVEVNANDGYMNVNFKAGASSWSSAAYPNYFEILQSSGNGYLRLYNTGHPDVSNYERLGIYWASNVCNIKPEWGGTGVQRDLSIDGVVFKGTGWAFSQTFGIGNAQQITGTASVAVGNGAKVNTSASAFGYGAEAVSGASTAIGYLAKANAGTGAVALGANAVASGGNASLALGYASLADTAKTVCFGAPSDPNLAVSDVFFGSSRVSAAPQGCALNASGGSGTDIGGASLTIAGGRGTGAGVPGFIFFSTANVGGTGALLQTLVQRWVINSQGHFLAGADNTYDVGTPAASRPRTFYVGTSVEAPRIRTTTLTVATLPAAATAGAGARAFVTDANANTFGGAVAGGGANKVPVYSDGAAWLIG